MKVLICGGRDFADVAAIKRAMTEVNPSFVITGGAKGADAIADKQAELRGIARVVYPANWTGDGHAAGPIRNQRMIDHGRPDLVVAFAGGKGTADMVRRALAAGIPVKEIHPSSV
jgi:aspartokinase-like uncharacterized kinase